MMDLSNEELACRIKEGADADGKLILQLLNKNMAFIRMRARPFVDSGSLDAEELTGIGYLATTQAVDRWDESRGAKFISILNFCLIRELVNAANDSKAVPVSSGMNEILREYSRFLKDFREVHQREPTVEEGAALLSVTEKKYKMIAATYDLQRPVSLDSPIETNAENEGGEAVTLAETIAGGEDVEESAIEIVYLDELKKAVFYELSRLPDAEQEIIRLHFLYAVPLSKETMPIYRKALKSLRSPSVRDRMKNFLDANMYAGSGLNSYRRTGTSQPEKFAILHASEGRDKK